MKFGNQLFAKWHGLNMQDVYKDWAEALSGCTIGAINCGIALAGNEPHPPNQHEFIAHCQKYIPVSVVPKLGNNFTPEQIEINKKRIADIVANFAKGKAA